MGLLGDKSSSKYFTDPDKVLVSFEMVEFQALMQFPIAYRAQVYWMTHQLWTTKAFHQALIIRTMSHSKHVSQLMRCYLNNRHQHSLFFLLFSLILGTCKVFAKSTETVYSTQGWHSISISIRLKILCTNVHIRKWQNCNAIRFRILNRSNNLSENLNSIILLFALWINLRANIKLFIVKNITWKIREELNLARLEISFDP